MLSLSIFPSLPFRAVELLSCDITPRRGKPEQPRTPLYPTGKQAADLLWSQMQFHNMQLPSLSLVERGVPTAENPVVVSWIGSRVNGLCVSLEWCFQP